MFFGMGEEVQLIRESPTWRQPSYTPPQGSVAADDTPAGFKLVMPRYNAAEFTSRIDRANAVNKDWVQYKLHVIQLWLHFDAPYYISEISNISH